MSLADHFGLFALGAGRNRPRDGQAALQGLWRQVQVVRAQVQERRDPPGALADLGWQAAHLSLWGDDAEAIPDTTTAKADDLKFF